MTDWKTLDAVAQLSRELLIELDTYWSGVSGPSLSGIMLDWRNKYRILLEDSGAAQAAPDREKVARVIAEQLGENFDRLPDRHLQPGFCQADFYNCADAIRNAALEESALYHDKAAADCRAIALCNPDNDLGVDSETHAIDHEIAAKDIREMKT